MNDPDGIALMFAMAILGIFALLVLLFIEVAIFRSQDMKRLNKNQRGREAQHQEWISNGARYGRGSDL